MRNETHDALPETRLPLEPPRQDLDPVSTKAEAGVIERQARQVQPLKDEENLLKNASANP